jgi:folate-dependent phosphoribosylglycinamide formyltransferase PurN
MLKRFIFKEDVEVDVYEKPHGHGKRHYKKGDLVHLKPSIISKMENGNGYIEGTHAVSKVNGVDVYWCEAELNTGEIITFPHTALSAAP